MENFDSVAKGLRGCHIGPPFADGLVLETLRGASDMLADEYDAELDATLEGMIQKIKAASDAIEDIF